MRALTDPPNKGLKMSGSFRSILRKRFQNFVKKFATRATISRRLRARSLEKSLFGGLQKSPRKHPKKSKNTRKVQIWVFFGYFRVFFDFFGDFFADPPKRRFSRLFSDFWPEGPGDSCSSGRKKSFRSTFVLQMCHPKSFTRVHIRESGGLL